MSTSSPSINNCIGIITDAMYDAGKLRQGEDPGSEDLAVNMRRLNKLVRYYMTQGCKLWVIENITLTLTQPISNTVGVPLYTLGPSGTVVMQKPLRVISAYYLDIYGNQRPLVPLSYPNEYEMLGQLLQPGAINSYAVDKQPLTLNVYLWPPPDSYTATNGTVQLFVENSVTEFVGLADNMAFPAEWAIALEWGLAEQICTGQPVSVQLRCASMSARYQTALENWDVEDADTMFQPDQRATQGQGRFR